jgi:1-acyl-sn-glycerol-3-phosphate acyltransferase
MTQTDAEIITLDDVRRRNAAGRCQAVTPSGQACRNHADRGGFCRVHAARFRDEPAGETRLAHPSTLAPERDTDEAIANALAFLRRRLTGDYDIDVFGFDRELTEHVLMPLARPLYRSYWRVSATGLHNVPDDSGALIVANHSGTLPFDAIMTKVALLDDHPSHRHLRELAADLALRVPVIGALARKTGNTLAHDDDAIRLLEAGELVGVWPEGFKGVGKHYRDRYKLQRFGRGGFVEVALRTQTPIIPVAIIGAEEIFPIIANVKFLARLFGFPYFPITWQFPALGPLGLMPLPSKWLIDFGEPIDTTPYGPEAADDPMLVFELTDRVRDTIQQMLYRNLMGRRSIFF